MLLFIEITHQISSEGVNDGVKNELVIILNILNNNPLQKANEIAEQLNKGESTVERYLKILKNQGLIEFDGAPKTGGIEIELKIIFNEDWKNKTKIGNSIFNKGLCIGAVIA
jgi:predicted transcriptional regulator